MADRVVYVLSNSSSGTQWCSRPPGNTRIILAHPKIPPGSTFPQGQREPEGGRGQEHVTHFMSEKGAY